MEKTAVKQLEIKLKDTEIDTFKSIIDKVSNETKSKGFSDSVFNEDEKKLIKYLKES